MGLLCLLLSVDCRCAFDDEDDPCRSFSSLREPLPESAIALITLAAVNSLADPDLACLASECLWRRLLDSSAVLDARFLEDDLTDFEDFFCFVDGVSDSEPELKKICWLSYTLSPENFSQLLTAFELNGQKKLMTHATNQSNKQTIYANFSKFAGSIHSWK